MREYKVGELVIAQHDGGEKFIAMIASKGYESSRHVMARPVKIENVTSYSDIKNEIIKFVSASQYKTLEKLITDLKKQLDDKFPIQIEKLEINKIEIAKKYNAKKVSVSI